MDERLKLNRAHWDERAHLHATGETNYRIDAFKRGTYGWDRNVPDDLGEVRGLKLLHLQCHFGMDSLMWAREGADVTGVDFSETAVAHARALSAEVQVPARFVCGAIEDLPASMNGQFDAVLTYHGTITWLPDLKPWAATVARCLKPGGWFYLCDTHPFAHTLDVTPDGGRLDFHYSYFPQGPERCEGAGSYSAPQAKTEHNVTYQWLHTLGEVVTALASAGLRIEYLHEFPYTFWNAYQGAQGSLMRHREADWWHLKEGDGKPLMFSLKASKAG